MLKSKKIFVYAGTAASVAFMMTMLFRTDDVESVEAVSAAAAIDQAMAKKNYGTDVFGNSIRGTVMVNGKTPMPHGTVIIYDMASARRIGNAEIEPEGTYSVYGLPLGEVQLLVTPRTNIRFHDGKPRRPVRRNDPTRNPAEVLSTPGISVATNIKLSSERKPRKQAADLSAFEQWNKDEKGGAIQVFNKIEELYGSLGSPKKITTAIFEGQNNFNIEIDTHAESVVEAKEETKP